MRCTRRKGMFVSLLAVLLHLAGWSSPPGGVKPDHTVRWSLPGQYEFSTGVVRPQELPKIMSRKRMRAKPLAAVQAKLALVLGDGIEVSEGQDFQM